MARIVPTPSVPPGPSVMRPPTGIPSEELKALSDVIQAALKQRQKVRASLSHCAPQKNGVLYKSAEALATRKG